MKYDPTLKFFLTCENSEEFERLKSDPKEFSGSSSIAVTTLKNFQFKDTFNYLYSSLKSKLVSSTEPEEVKAGLELSVITDKIAQYLRFLDKNIVLLTSKIEFEKKCLEEQGKLTKMFEDVQEDDAELERTFRNVAELHRKEAGHLKVIAHWILTLIVLRRKGHKIAFGNKGGKTQARGYKKRYC